MDFKEAVKGLAVDEAAALKVLERAGWQIGLEVRIEDMRLPNGMRRRTFSNSGRYALAVFLKNPSRRDVVEVPAFAAESSPEPLPVVEKAEATVEVKVVPMAETIEAVAGDEDKPAQEEIAAPRTDQAQEKKTKEKKTKRSGGGRR